MEKSFKEFIINIVFYGKFLMYDVIFIKVIINNFVFLYLFIFFLL